MSRRNTTDTNAPSLAQIDLRILATTDLHACLTAWDYYAHKPHVGRGLARVATLIRAARAECANSLLVDNGDFLSGSGIGDLLAAQYPAPLPHPMVAAMNALAYDAVNLGNHEFSHGLPFLLHSLKDARFSVVCSNFAFQDLPFVQKTVLVTRIMRDDQNQSHAIKVGIIGLLPAQTLVWEAAHLHGRAHATPMLEAARASAEALRRQGAQVIVALAHTGLKLLNSEVSAGEEHIAEQVAALPDIDVVIAGHSHQHFPTRDDSPNTAMVLPGFFGSHLGVVDITLQRATGGWQVAQRSAHLRPIAQRTPLGTLSALVADTPEIRAFGEASHAFITQKAAQPIGHSEERLHSYFATVAPSAAMAVVAQAQKSALALQLSGGPYADLPIISAVAPFKAGGRGGPENYTDLAAGPLLHHHAADLYMHPNRLVGFRMSGAEVALWLERAASKYYQIAPNAQDARLINPDYPSFNCDMIYGLEYEIDLRQPPMFSTLGAIIHPSARRITNLRFHGAPVQPDQLFALASNSYRREGKLGFAGTSKDHIIADSAQLIQSLLRDFIAQHRPLPQLAAPHWRFAAMPGASVWVATSPTATEVLGDIAHFRPEPIGLDDAGFLRFRLHL